MRFASFVARFGLISDGQRGPSGRLEDLPGFLVASSNKLGEIGKDCGSSDFCLRCCGLAVSWKSDSSTFEIF